MEVSNKFRVYLQGDIPKFGDGWREITVDKEGRKWVYLSYHGRKKAKVSKELWQKVLKTVQ